MKTCQYLALLLLWCASCCADPTATDNTDSTGPTLRFSSAEIKPFLFHQEGKLTGLSYDIIVAACKEIGVTPQFSIKPFRRSHLEVLQGGADGMLVLRIPGYDEVLFPNLTLSSVTIFHQRVFIIGLTAQNITISQLEDLAGYHVGHIRLLPELHDILIPVSEQKSIFNNTRQLLKALLANRIDVAIVSPSMIPDINSELAIENTRFVQLFEYPLQPVTIAWTQNSQRAGFSDMTREFDQALIALKKSGAIKTIISRYLDPSVFIFDASHEATP
ncbi:hypothetical protein R50073_09210 [Maricurvus nonylphenolicus]|uniref:substrate-binding periplasmic protein n=1 Tax=Maricurvus nonylphenolicus TaxID=1008307 RepID=UPI0036F31AD2